jgi:hypothetical protein
MTTTILKNDIALKAMYGKRDLRSMKEILNMSTEDILRRAEELNLMNSNNETFSENEVLEVENYMLNNKNITFKDILNKFPYMSLKTIYKASDLLLTKGILEDFEIEQYVNYNKSKTTANKNKDRINKGDKNMEKQSLKTVKKTIQNILLDNDKFIKDNLDKDIKWISDKLSISPSNIYYYLNKNNIEIPVWSSYRTNKVLDLLKENPTYPLNILCSKANVNIADREAFNKVKKIRNEFLNANKIKLIEDLNSNKVKNKDTKLNKKVELMNNKNTKLNKVYQIVHNNKVIKEYENSDLLSATAYFNCLEDMKMKDYKLVSVEILKELI